MRYLLIALIAIFFGACAQTSTKSVLEDARYAPQITINSVKIKAISLDSIILESNIAITNFLPLGVNIKDAMINIYYDDKIINSYKITDTSAIRPRSTNTISLDSDIRINDLAKIIKDFKARDSIDFKIEVATTILVPNDTSAGESRFSYNLREKFDLQIPPLNPKISLKNADISREGISVTLNVRNDATPRFGLENISYNIRLGGIDFSGEAKTLAQSDNSTDIIIENLRRLPPREQNGFGITLNAILQLENQRIPIYLNKDFK